MAKHSKISLHAAALITGFSILGSVIVAPFAELYAYPKLIVSGSAAETANNIINHRELFVAAMFCYLITFLLDIVLAWSLHILLRPVNENLSMLTAWLRLTYSIIAIVALNNLVTTFRLLTTSDFTTLFDPTTLQAQAMIYIRAFRYHWYFGIIFFAFHLMLLGYLCFRSGYIPRVLGIILVITGIGYLLTSLKPYLFPGINMDFARFTFYGELIFMLWLLIRGWRIREIG
jgi:hypothetical protein